MNSPEEIKKTIEIEDERKVNSIIALIMILFCFVEVTFIMLFYFYPDIFVYFKNGYSLLALSLFTFIPAIIQFICPKHLKWMKYVLLPVLLAMTTCLDYYASIATFVLFILPTILVAQYHSKKYCFIIYISSIIALTISSIVVYIAAKNGVYSGVFEYDFSDPIITFVNFYLCKIILYVIVAATSYSLMIYNKNSLDKQLKYSRKLSSIKSEIDTASGIQTSILPTNFNTVVSNGYHLYASMKPAKEVGGDFYDFFYSGNKLIVLVGDVSDKGLSAAMFMMNVINTIRALASNESNISNILTKANKIISDNNKELMYVTIWMAAIDILTGEAEYINAGHCPAFIKDMNNKIVKLQTEPQIFLGVDDSIIYKSQLFTLPKGSNLFLYTDGVTDAFNKQNISFGENGVINVLSSSGSEPQQLISKMEDSINQFIEEAHQFDDITMLSIKNNGFEKEIKCSYSLDSVTSIIDITNKILKRENVSEDLINLIDSAVDDVACNIVDYSKNENADYFLVKYSTFEGNFVITFVDYGFSFNPLEYKKPDLSDNRTIGGLGIYLFKNIMDECFWQRINDSNVLTLIKKIN